jgi:hypothetical protein
MKRQDLCSLPLALAAAACALAAAGTSSFAAERSAHGAAAPASPLPPAASWKAVAASGRVEARPADARDDAPWLPLLRGDELAPLTLVQTGHRGRATLTQGGSVMIVDPDSRVELPETGYGLSTSVVQPSGSVLYQVEGKKYPHFEVVTPYLVAGVKGTSFLVTVTDEYTAVTVEGGVVEVLSSRSGKQVEVRAGESIVQDGAGFELEHFAQGAELSEAARKESRRLARMDRPDARAGDPPDARPQPSAGRPTPADSAQSAEGHAAAPAWVDESTREDSEKGDGGKGRDAVADAELIDIPGKDEDDAKGGEGKGGDDEGDDDDGDDDGDRSLDLDEVELPEAVEIPEEDPDPREGEGRQGAGRGGRR